MTDLTTEQLTERQAEAKAAATAADVLDRWRNGDVFPPGGAQQLLILLTANDEFAAAMVALHSPARSRDGSVICTGCDHDDWDGASAGIWPCRTVAVLMETFAPGLRLAKPAILTTLTKPINRDIKEPASWPLVAAGAVVRGVDGVTGWLCEGPLSFTQLDPERPRDMGDPLWGVICAHAGCTRDVANLAAWCAPHIPDGTAVMDAST
jgi:hypothetical protein